MSPMSTASQDLVDDLVGNAHGNFSRVKEILSEHPDLVNARARWGETPIQAAAQMGNMEITEYLLDRGAPLDICTAAMLGLADTVKIFLVDDRTLALATGAHEIPVLYFAVIHGNLQIAQMLFRAGAHINEGDGRVTPLHAAAMFKQPTMAEWLIKNGAKTEMTDFNGRTPLQVAEENGSTEVAEIIRKARRP